MEGVRSAAHADTDRVAELCRWGLEEAQDRRGGALLTRRELDPTARALVRPGGLARIMGDPRRTVLVGTVDEVPVGLLAARVDDVLGTALGVVDFCFVEPTARGVGVGRALLDAAVAWFVGAGCRGVDVPVLPGDRAAKQWLEGAGFTARALTMHWSTD